MPLSGNDESHLINTCNFQRGFELITAVVLGRNIPNLRHIIDGSLVVPRGKCDNYSSLVAFPLYGTVTARPPPENALLAALQVNFAPKGPGVLNFALGDAAVP